MTIVLKLGGSLITEKTDSRRVDTAILSAVASTIGDATPDQVVIVHGGGSFGHPVAAMYGASASEPITDPDGIVAISRAMETLNAHVIDTLHDKGVPAIPLSPRGFSVIESDESVSVWGGGLTAALNAGFIPVTYGEIVPTPGGGCAILSGDHLATAIGRTLEAERIGLCSNVPGVLDDDNAVIPRVTDLDSIRPYVDAPEGTDVTGGIEGKVAHLLDVPIPSAIFGRDALSAFLNGALPGTQIDPTGNAGSF